MLNIDFPNKKLIARCPDNRYINGQSKILWYQEIIFIQQMDMYYGTQPAVCNELFRDY